MHASVARMSNSHLRKHVEGAVYASSGCRKPHTSMNITATFLPRQLHTSCQRLPRPPACRTAYKMLHVDQARWKTEVLHNRALMHVCAYCLALRWVNLMLPHESTGLLESHFKQQSKKSSIAACNCYNQAIQCSACAVVHTSTAQQDAQS